jgi:large subunit ribosomal protein L7Ae
MPGKAKTVAQKPATKAAAPYKASKVSHFEARPKNFGIGADVPYNRDISRFMHWPVFVTRQRKMRVLQRRLKIPPALHQFQRVLDRSTRNEVLKLLKKYTPETRKQRRDRVKKAAEAKAKDSKKTVHQGPHRCPVRYPGGHPCC